MREYPRGGRVDLSMSEPLSVQIWSDVQCPWCYIGKRKFEAALAELAADPEAPQVEVVYRSFELAPDTPVDFEGTPVDYLSQRKGIAPEQARAMIDRVSGIGRDAEVDLRAAVEFLRFDLDLCNLHIGCEPRRAPEREDPVEAARDHQDQICVLESRRARRVDEVRVIVR